MKIVFISILVILVAGTSCDKNPEAPGCGIEVNENTDARSLSILFIGTSHTFFNEMPEMVSLIGRSIGDSVYTKMSAPGGYDFERHHKLDSTKALLNARKWDYIVLQESGWRAALPTSHAETRIYPFADSLQRLIKSSNPSAGLILYMTNGYLGGVNAFGDTAWCRSDPQVCTFDGMLDRIKGTYMRLATQLHAEIAPCGLIWKVLRSKSSNIILHDADGIHPGLAGSYTNAITIYSIIRRKPMKKIYVPAALPVDQSMLIQNTISDVLFDCNPAWKDL